MSFITNQGVEQNSLIGRPCWYRKPYNEDITASIIKEVDIQITKKTKTVTCYLENGTVAVLHNYNCPDFIGRAAWGFLSKYECERYWDM